MPSRSRSRESSRGRSRSPRSADSRSPRRRTPRSTSPRHESYSRSPAHRRNGRARDSRSRSYSRSRSFSRDDDASGRSRTRSVTPPLRSTKIVVERLSKNITEDHLAEIFGQYGEIRDLDLPMNRQFNTNRGTAYILFVHEADAEAAIANMHEAQVDGAVIHVSIVLPRRKLSPSPPLAQRLGANIDPRNKAPPAARGYGGGRPRFGPPTGPSGRYGSRGDAYRPASPGARSRSRSPYSNDHRRMRSRSPAPPRRGGRHDSRRSRSRESYSSFDRQSRSRSRSRSRGR